MSVLSERLAQRLKIIIEPLERKANNFLISANGSTMAIVGEANITMYIRGLCIHHRVKVVRHLQNDLLLGCDWLIANQVVLDYNHGFVTIADEMIRIPMMFFKKSQWLVSAIESVCVPPLSEALVSVRCPHGLNDKTVLMEALPSFKMGPFLLARSFSRIKNGKSICKVINCFDQALVLRKGIKMAYVEPLRDLASVKPFKEPEIVKGSGDISSIAEPMDEATLEQFAMEYKFKINPSLTKDQRVQLLQLLYSYSDVFPRTLKELKRYPHYSLELEMVNKKKYYRRQFRLSQEDTEEVDKQIQDMLQADVIEPCTSVDYNSCLFTVLKKNGSKRVVIDLRGVNELINHVTVQLPKISDVLHDVFEEIPNYVTTTDMFSGYYQIMLHENSRKYTAFTNPQSGIRYQYKTCPFGLVNSPAAMLTVIASIFSDKKKFPGLSIYMDDHILVSQTYPEHLKRLENLLETLRQNCLSLNATKCEFLFHSVDFLGFSVDKNGTTISDSKYKIIQKLQPPKSTKSLQRLLGSLGYFRKYIHNFAQNSYHLRQLLHQDTPFIWTPDCHREFSYLKDTLLKKPILVPLKTDKNLVIFTDASKKLGFGYCLLQPDSEGQLKVVAYGSQAAHKACQNYSAAEMECLALCLALKHYEIFALQKEITVYTDNSSLLYWNRLAPSNAKFRRILCYLMQFRLKIRYVKGDKNCLADWLSRVYEDFKPEDIAEFEPKLDAEDFIFALENNTDTEMIKNNTTNVDIKQDCLNNDVFVASNEDTKQWGMYECKAVRFPSISDCIETDDKTIQVLFSPEENVNKDKENSNDEQHLDVVTQQPSSSGADIFVSQSQSPDEENLVQIDNQENNHSNNDTELQKQQDEELSWGLTDNVKVPDIVLQDYFTDNEFCNIINYLLNGQLTGEDAIDRVTLLLFDQFLIENDLLFRLTTPRSKKERHVKPISKRLCVPQAHRFIILDSVHQIGHPGQNRMYLTLSHQFYWRTLYKDVVTLCQTCDICQRSKRHYGRKVTPLNPILSPSVPFQSLSVDHKMLCRKTRQGNVAILCIIDQFSGFPILKAVKDCSARTTAEVLFRDCFSIFGCPEMILSDSGPAFVSQLFKELNKFLLIKHRMSSPGQSRSNGAAERLIGQVATMIRTLCEDDSQIEDVLPLIELNIRHSVHTGTLLSPFEIVFGRVMSIGAPLHMLDVPTFSKDQHRLYYEWLTTKLKTVHEGILTNRIQSKLEQKRAYDKKHNVKQQTFKIGDKILIKQDKIKPHSTQVLTKDLFDGPYFITNIIETADIGRAYKLVNVETGKPIRRLVSADRMKLYYDDRLELIKRTTNQSKLVQDASKWEQTDRDVVNQSTSKQKVDDIPSSNDYIPAKRVLRQRRNKGKIEYYVLFEDNTRAWATDLSPVLMQRYRLLQERRREKRRLLRRRKDRTV